MKKIKPILNSIILLITINSFGQLTNGLKAYYAFGGNANDVSGQNNNGNVVGTLALTSDRFGTLDCAYQFPGNATDYININYSTDFDIPETGAFSISLWFQGGTPDGGDFEILFGKENPLITPAPYDYHLALYDSNNPSFGSLYSPIVMSFANHPNPDPNWHHVVSIYENKKWYIYEDNVLTGSNTTENYGIFQSANNLVIGKYFTGKIDDIRFYDRVLSASEITQLYNLPGSCQNLSIDEERLANVFSVYPNPAKNTLHITSPNNASENHVIYIYDITGREVLKKETVLGDTVIDISTLREGTYLIKNKIGENIQTKLILKQN